MEAEPAHHIATVAGPWFRQELYARNDSSGVRRTGQIHQVIYFPVYFSFIFIKGKVGLLLR